MLDALEPGLFYPLRCGKSSTPRFGPVGAHDHARLPPTLARFLGRTPFKE
ncbi:hypothetical protein [Deinococcus sp.]